MSTYTAPHRAQHKRHLSRRTKILLAAGLLVPVSLLAIANAPVKAAASNNPIFATLQDVQNAIDTALAPINNAIANLQDTQTAHTQQISDLQTQQQNQAQQINNLQSSTSKQLTVYDANGQELGLVVNHDHDQLGNASFDAIFLSSLSRFIYIREYASTSNLSDFAGFFSVGFQTSDCSGTAYASFGPYFNANDVLPLSPSVSYVANSPATLVTYTRHSFATWNWSTNQLVCNSLGLPDTRQEFPLTPVSLPFQWPITYPLQYKYQ